MTQPKRDIFPLLYFLAFFLALGMRFLLLGSQPLSDPEAGWALQALGISLGDPAPIGAQPLYLTLTGALFFLFGSDDFLARFAPALAGALLVFVPVLFRRQLGSTAALCLCFGLALDPGLVALSRLAGSPILAISFTLLGLGFWINGRAALAGICAGLALLGGPDLWPGWVGLALSILVYWQFFRKYNFQQESQEGPTPQSSFPWKTFFLAGVLTLLIAGTLFTRFPRGLNALAASLPAYLSGWGRFAGVQPLRLLEALLGYSLLAVIFGVWDGVYAWLRRDALDRFLSIWLVVSLLLAISYPSRQVDSLGWTLIPLWALAARGLSRLPVSRAEDRTPAWVYSIIVLIVIGFAWLNFTGFLTALQTDPGNQQVRGLAITGAIALLLIASILVGWGWSSRVATQGLLRGGTIALAIYLLAGATWAAGWHSPATAEMWDSYPQPVAQRYLMDTIGDLSRWSIGRPDGSEIVVMGFHSPALRWALRGIPLAKFADALAVGSQPQLVITAQADQPALAASYRGQDFVWGVEPNWSAMGLIDRLSWVAFHSGPMESQKIILWARSDLFPDHTNSPVQAAP
ncbi:MAG: hypothetical protein PHQ40_01135 [Anaerolineaceae bacterium]|nr:hypothetical protein [Anaerolineaceae bacterium]